MILYWGYFFERAKIGELWKNCYPQLLQINLQYQPFADIAIKQITEYCRVDSDYFKNKSNGKFHYQRIPLMSHFTAFFYETENDYWVISGPSKGEADPSAFYHEPLHKIINPIVESYPDLNMKIGDLVSLSQEKLDGDYRYITPLICESFVRTINRILSARSNKFTDDKLREIVEDEYRLGLILSFYLLENLPAYEEGNTSLKEYYPGLISKINIAFEKERWITFWKSREKK